MAKPIRRVTYATGTTRLISTWAKRMVEIEYGTHYTRYREQMDDLLQEIKDYADREKLNCENLYDSVWNKAKLHLHPDIFR